MERGGEAGAEYSTTKNVELTSKFSISVHIGPSPIEREKENRNDRREKKCPNNPHPHLLQAQ